ncbi:threonine synthase [Candidatus Persebacteraceae bacterium Df01]|jgi:threonine synthase|uniref:Threonine synthase n=1 Tax=Candidatus Doriopsillibacter californiensis TaxID=2970740 RepID=A0ABT7QMK8_9GAMM|nr:threonine synthase [Candidatus Persebacteraceae bacterium Df01]
MSGLIATYRNRLPLAADAPPLSLGEGNTPLVELVNILLPESVRLWVKIEGANPTASFKDRGMAVAIAAAVEQGARCVICASTGNTSASAAAYAARAKLPCIVLIPAGKVAAGKISQAVAHGAEIVQISGNFDDAMTVVKNFSDSGEVAVVNSINPMRLQGQKTAAFEIITDLPGVPDYHALPVGNAGNITAHWLGYSEAAGKGTAACTFCRGECRFTDMPVAKQRPTMLGYQAENAAPFLNGNPVLNPETVATAIRIGNPQSYEVAKLVLTESGGWVGAVSDAQILQTQKLLASQEGVFCEPASAASVAGVLADLKSEKLRGPARIVCTLTGHGLKNPEIFGAPDTRVVAAEVDAIRKLIYSTIQQRQ